MLRVTELKQFADECRELAAKQRKPQDKQRLQEMASAWELLALEQQGQMNHGSSGSA
jgi:hypothetical protein